MEGDEMFAPSSSGPTALFLDTSALFAHFHPDTGEHDEARTFLERVGANEIPYRPLYTSTYVVDELATLLLSKGSHTLARTALERTLDSDHVTLVSESDDDFADARASFERYDDHDISFTDQMTAAQMRNRSIDHVFAYDGDFRTLGFEQLPR